jgi:hypothetical protein
MFPEGVVRLHDGTIDFDGDAIFACLVKASFANTTLDDTNRDAFNYFDDIPAADKSSTTYKAFGTNDIRIDTTDDNVQFAEGTVSLTFPTVASGNSCRGILTYKSSGASSASPIICYSHFTANVTADGGTVTVNLAADGLFTLSYD